MKVKSQRSLIEIYSGSPWEASHVKKLLEASNVNATIKDGASDNFSMNVFVPQEHYANALRIVTKYASYN